MIYGDPNYALIEDNLRFVLEGMDLPGKYRLDTYKIPINGDYKSVVKANSLVRGRRVNLTAITRASSIDSSVPAMEIEIRGKLRGKRVDLHFFNPILGYVF